MGKKKIIFKKRTKNAISIVKKLVPDLKPNLSELIFSKHHQSQASAGFSPSPFNEATMLCMDGLGECATMSLLIGNKNKFSSFRK